MKTTALLKCACLVAAPLALCPAVTARADVFSQGPNRHSLTFVNVGNAGNAGQFDPNTGLTVGAVNYNYRISETEIPSSVYIEYLNAVGAATTSVYNGGSMNSATNNGSAIVRSGLIGSFTYAYNPVARDTDTEGRPVGGMTFYQAARFANWLQAGQPTGPTAFAQTNTGAYDLTLAGDARRIVQPGAQYWVPTENEWYKAAYYDPTLNAGAGGYWQYPTESNTVPSNFPFRTDPQTNPQGLHVNDQYQNPAWATSPTGIPDPGNNANYASNYAPGSANSVSTRAFSYTANGTAPLFGDLNGPFITEVGWFENSKSHYGTLDQGGNLWEFMPTTKDQFSNAVLRGGAYNSGGGNDVGIGGTSLSGTKSVVLGPGDIRGGRADIDPSYFDFENVGFGWRIASVPEPSTIVLILMGGLGLAVAACTGSITRRNPATSRVPAPEAGRVERSS